MTQRTKRIVSISLLVTLVSIMLLSASLSNLQLHEGRPFPGAGDSDTTTHTGAVQLPIKPFSSTFLQGLFAFIFLVLMIYVPARLIALGNLGVKKILISVLALVVLLILVTLLSRTTFGQSTDLSSETSNITTPPSFSYPTSPLGNPPRSFIWFVIIGSVLGLGFLMIVVLRRHLSSGHTEDPLLQEAESAVDALKSGIDFGNVIVRYYLRMTLALQEEQGIERGQNMTAREFEDRLEIKGIPREPIHQLTSLFEKFRYGTFPVTKDDEEMGIESLNEIIQFCREKRDLGQ